MQPPTSQQQLSESLLLQEQRLARLNLSAPQPHALDNDDGEDGDGAAADGDERNSFDKVAATVGKIALKEKRKRQAITATKDHEIPEQSRLDSGSRSPRRFQYSFDSYVTLDEMLNLFAYDPRG